MSLRSARDPFSNRTGDIDEAYRLGEALKGEPDGKSRKALARKLAKDRSCSVSLLYKCLQLADAYTWQEFEDLISLRKPNSDPLNLAHVFELMRMNDRGQRTKLQKQVASEGWSIRRLKNYLQNCSDHLKTVKLGRKPKVPDDECEMLRKLSKRSAEWLKLAEAIRNRPAESVSVHSRTRLHAQCRTKLRAAERAMALLVESVDALQKEFRKAADLD